MDQLAPKLGNSAGFLQQVDAGKVYFDLLAPQLYEMALQRGEACLSDGGALVARTGTHTGRSAQDKYIVCDSSSENTVWWDNNASMSEQHFTQLEADFRKHMDGHDLYVQNLIGGADPRHQLQTQVITEKAWHSLFIRNMLIRPDATQLAEFTPELTIVNLPGFRADPARHGTRSSTVIALDLQKRLVLIGGTAYAGEMKKSVFTVLNYLLPEKGIMPMHCSANVGHSGDAAVFFGLSGTGKTTLSADPNRTLIGDDEHGWSPDGLFNFEGGCYAKTIRLSAEAEPEIFSAANRFGTVLENVVLDNRRTPDFDDGSVTENTRCAYPLPFIANASETGQAGRPHNIVMLTADAFGVLPPISRLTPAQAMYHFLSGYTAKVAGTEQGVSEPKATFSACFGAPFMPRHPSVYGDMLRRLIAEHNVDCWLVNTGWTGGAYGVGNRMPIGVTRALLNAALDGSLKTSEFRRDENFGFDVPCEVPGIDNKLLNPRQTWESSEEYDRQAAQLVTMFADNFAQFADQVDHEVISAQPGYHIAAE